MRKVCFVLALTYAILCVYSGGMHIQASNNGEDLIDQAFVCSADVNVKSCGNDVTEISLSHTAEVLNSTYTSSNEKRYETEKVTFLATSEDKDDILNRIAEARSGGGARYDEDWFFGDSCYIYISISYSTRDVANGTEARIKSVTVRDSVNSGTYISDATLHLSCVGSSSDAGSVYLEKDIQVTSSPYTNTLMNSWPYINTNSPCLGANYTVTAKRSSGSSSTHTVSAHVFVN